jgi:hypothetical protein
MFFLCVYTIVSLQSPTWQSSDAPPTDIDGNDRVDSELSSNENASFLDDLDSVVDEVNAGLHISRSVTDVILKGILCDLQQKVTRQTASKDSEITLLKQLENGSLSLPEG